MKSDKKTESILQKNKLIKFCILVILIISQFCISGCWNYNEINNSAIPLAIGFDYKDNEAMFSMQLAKPSTQESPGSSSEKALVVSAVGSNIIEADRRLMLSFPRTPIWSHAGTMVIGEGLASRDVGMIIDLLARNKNLRKTANLYIFSGGTVDKCMETKMPLEPYSVPALDKMIKNQEQLLGIYVAATVNQFEEKLENPGIEATAPRVTIKNKLLTLDGTAIFKGRKMAGVLNEKESRGFRYLSPKQINGGILTANYPRGSQNQIVMELIRSQASVKPKIGSHTITMQIKIIAEGNYYGQNSAANILSAKNIKGMEEEFNREIAGDVEAAISKAQSLECDIFGWGQETSRSQPAVWNQVQNNWPSIFAGVKTDVTVDFKLRRTYLTDKSFKFRE